MRKLENRLIFNYSGNPHSVFLSPGKYLFELWGASGEVGMCGLTFSVRGRGGYTRGILSLSSRKEFFIYVGRGGKYQSEIFNGNFYGKNAIQGGGSTDVRLIGGLWHDFESLKSRIIVSGGGGGGDCMSGGDSGGLEGLYGDTHPNIQTLPGPGTQTNGGSGSYYYNFSPGFSGEFGIGGTGQCIDNPNCDGAGSGGGGYYGGGGITGNGGGSGGSSFISGHDGCNAISSDSTESSIIHTNQPIHYSGISFQSTFIIDGNSNMPSPSPEYPSEIGHRGHGFAIITFIESTFVHTCSKTPYYLRTFIILIIPFLQSL